MRQGLVAGVSDYVMFTRFQEKFSRGLPWHRCCLHASLSYATTLLCAACSFCPLTGPFPRWLAKCYQKLEELDLSNNRVRATMLLTWHFMLSAVPTARFCADICDSSVRKLV